MVALLFYVELVLSVLTLAVLWVLYIGQWMTLRCTPKKRRNETKTNLIIVGSVGCFWATLRCPDTSGGLGLYSQAVSRTIYIQLGVWMLGAVVIVMMSSARALAMQMQRQVPPHFRWIMVGLLAALQISTIPVFSLTFKYDNDGNYEKVQQLWFIGAINYTAASIVILIVYWWLYIGLSKRVKAFLRTLEQQEGRKKIGREASVMSGHRAAGGEDAAVAGQAGTASNRAAVTVGRAVSVVNGKPLAVTVAPPAGSGADDADLGAPVTAGGGVDDGVNSPEHRLAAALSSAATDASEGGAVDAGAPSPVPVELPASPSAAARNGSGGAHNTVVSISIQPGQTLAAGLAQGGQQPNSRQVAPLIAPTIVVVAPAGTASTSVAAVAPSQSDSRVAELYGALRKMNWLSLLTNFLMIATCAVQVPNEMKHLKGQHLSYLWVSPSDSAAGGTGKYPTENLLILVVNLLALATILWYAWSSPRVVLLRGEERRKAGFAPLFDMLLNGVTTDPQTIASRHQPGDKKGGAGGEGGADNREVTRTSGGAHGSTNGNGPRSPANAAGTRGLNGSASPVPHHAVRIGTSSPTVPAPDAPRPTIAAW